MTECIFCSNPADSKEDMFPRWIHKKIKTREPLSREVGDIQAEITEDQEVRIKCVCETCNNGWMSRLEMKCKPIVGSLLEDLSLRLDAEHRKFLSEWPLKTAMVTDACEGRTRVASPRCNDSVHRSAEPRNWIARKLLQLLLKFRKTRGLPSVYFPKVQIGH